MGANSAKALVVNERDHLFDVIAWHGYFREGHYCLEIFKPLLYTGLCIAVCLVHGLSAVHQAHQAPFVAVYLGFVVFGLLLHHVPVEPMGSTLACLGASMHALCGWPTPFGAASNSTHKPLGNFDQAADAAAIQACHTVAEQVVNFARMRRSR